MGCNQNFAVKNGFSRIDEIIGKTDYDLKFTEEEVAGFIKDDKAVMESGTPKLHILEQAHVTEEGIIHFDTTKIPMKDQNGKVYGVLIVALDVMDFYNNVLKGKKGEVLTEKGPHAVRYQ